MIDAFTAVSWPGRVVFGAGRLDRVPSEVGRLGIRRVLIVHGASGVCAAERVIRALDDRAIGTFEEVRQHVPEAAAVAAVERARERGADGVVTIGGGSATGLGKAIALETGVPIVAIPTTYAGSEMTPVYGITGEHKRTGRDPAVLPRTVIYDPELTLDLPVAGSATSGMNAVAQAVEACWSAPEEPVTTLLAREAIRVLADALPRVVATPHDLDARSDALYGAFLAGTCLARVTTGLHHKLCHAVGGTYGLPHAATHAVLLPHVAAFNAPAAPETATRIADALQADDPGRALHDLNRRLGNPTGLHDLGLPEGAAARIAQMVAPDAASLQPRPATEEDLRTLLAAAR